MKAVEKLMNAKKEVRAGNHQNIIDGDIRKFIYFNTAICTVNDAKKEFSIDASWGSVSTTKTCNAYEREFKALGYTKIN